MTAPRQVFERALRLVQDHDLDAYVQLFATTARWRPRPRRTRCAQPGRALTAWSADAEEIRRDRPSARHSVTINGGVLDLQRVSGHGVRMVHRRGIRGPGGMVHRNTPGGRGWTASVGQQ